MEMSCKFISPNAYAGIDTNGCPIARGNDFRWGQVQNYRQCPPEQ